MNSPANDLHGAFWLAITDEIGDVYYATKFPMTDEEIIDKTNEVQRTYGGFMTAWVRDDRPQPEEYHIGRRDRKHPRKHTSGSKIVHFAHDPI